MHIREAKLADFITIWPIFHDIATAGDTYPYDPETTREEGFDLWMVQPQKTFVIEEEKKVLGTYYIKPNQPGLGNHVCNCGYMVAADGRRRGLATAMCRHSQQEAMVLGYRAMQFNLVVATNEGAIRLWQKLGFDVVGRLPGAFRHREMDFVDALIMYKWLVQSD